MVAAHSAGNKNACIDLENVDNHVGDATKLQIYDLYSLKRYAITLATNAARTVLEIDQVRRSSCSSLEPINLTTQIIMAKPAGGPKQKQGPKGMDTADDD